MDIPNFTTKKDLVAIVLAGGKGERLFPLTRDRTKPAVPFGGTYRIIDFTLSNCINSGIRKIGVLTQYKSNSLNNHLRLGWNIFNSELGEFIIPIPAQQRVGIDWYRGTADAVFQNFFTIEQMRAKYVLILAGDHIYQMNYQNMLRYHIEKGADMTIGAIEIHRRDAHKFGIMQTNEQNQVIGFQEKPKTLASIAIGERTLASMGIYLFNPPVLKNALSSDALMGTEHDFGKNIVPGMVNSYKVVAYPFSNELEPEKLPYWRDVGDLDSYYEASMDLTSVTPELNLYNKNWPIRTYQGQHPPAKTVFAQEKEEGGRKGVALDSIVSPGCIISGGKVQRSILSPNTRINSFSLVENSILMEGVEIGRHCKIRKAIIDKWVSVPPNMVIGYDPEEDKKRFYTTPKGVVVIPRLAIFDSEGKIIEPAVRPATFVTT